MNEPLSLARPELVGLPGAGVEEAPKPIRLDANEVPWRPMGDRSRAGLNRYPPLRAQELGRRLARLYGCAPERLLPARGSDEAIDLLVRGFCRPGLDSVLVLPPTFAMYELAARIQGAGIVEVARSRQRGFAIDTDAVASALGGVKLVFVADPDNPTGRAVPAVELEALVEATRGRALLVLDRAYGEFANREPSPLAVGGHVVELRTLSKAHALAGARCGALIGDPGVVDLLRRIQAPYALTQPTLEAVEAQLTPRALALTRRRIARLVEERDRLACRLEALPGVLEVFPSRANFLLVAFEDRERVRRRLAEAGIAVRRPADAALTDCLRLTVGSAVENRRLLALLEIR